MLELTYIIFSCAVLVVLATLVAIMAYDLACMLVSPQACFGEAHWEDTYELCALEPVTPPRMGDFLRASRKFPAGSFGAGCDCPWCKVHVEYA